MSEFESRNLRLGLGDDGRAQDIIPVLPERQKGF